MQHIHVGCRITVFILYCLDRWPKSRWISLLLESGFQAASYDLNGLELGSQLFFFTTWHSKEQRSPSTALPLNLMFTLYHSSLHKVYLKLTLGHLNHAHTMLWIKNLGLDSQIWHLVPCRKEQQPMCGYWGITTFSTAKVTSVAKIMYCHFIHVLRWHLSIFH